jgi:cob(I)alamin adenosyltransferase
MSVDNGFEQPRLAINRVYTRRGDTGRTSLAGGQRLPKNDLRIEAYGTVDELNSFIGLARESARELPELDPILRRVQHELFNLGSILATLPEDVHPKQARITPAESEQLEREIDRMNEGLPVLRSFVLPGGSRDSEIPEPAQRRAIRLEPLGQPSARYSRNAVGAQPGGLSGVTIRKPIVAVLVPLNDYRLKAGRIGCD